jgi:RNA polymerase sigma-70 factor (ECF subfamily)
MNQVGSLKEIFNLLRHGKKEGVRLLYNLHYNDMFAIAFSIVKNKRAAEDVVHNVVYKFLTMDACLFPCSYEGSWLFSVIKHEAFSFLRKESKIIPIDSIKELETEDKDIEKYYDIDEFQSMIRSLDEERRIVVSLKILCNYTHKEIAQLLGKPTGTIQWLYNTSIKKLRVVLSALVGIVVMFLCATAIEATIYMQQITTSFDSIGTPVFYIDYLLIAEALLLIASAIILIIVYKKSDRLPTKSFCKSI